MLLLLVTGEEALRLPEALSMRKSRCDSLGPRGAWALLLLRLLLRLLGLLRRKLLRLLLRLRDGDGFRSGLLFPRPALTTRGCAEKIFDGSVMSRRRRRRGNVFTQNVVEVVGEFVAAWIDVDGGVEGLDVYRLFYAPLDPVVLRGQDGKVLFTEMIVLFPCMLQHCQLELP